MMLDRVLGLLVAVSAGALLTLAVTRRNGWCFLLGVQHLAVAAANYLTGI